jgi:hypothetical protein
MIFILENNKKFVIQFSGEKTLFGTTAPSPSADLIQLFLYYVGGLGMGICFGVVGIILSTLAGAATGYLGSTEKPEKISGEITPL